jgi:predicted TIM-barrel fold metal-dependent hydrolase
MVIDGDAHCNEPKDLFDRYLEKEFRDCGPRAVDAGGMRWLVEGKFLPRPVGNWGDGSSELRRAIKQLGCVGTVVPASSAGEISTTPPSHHFSTKPTSLAQPWGFTGSRAGFDSPGQERFKDPYFYIHMVGMPFNLMIGIMTLIGGGIMEKYPRIKFVFLEIGAAWLPYWMWRMDDHYSRSMHHPAGVPKKPSDYVRSDSCFVSCEPDEEGLDHTTEVLGADRIVFASDYPHGDCDFPHSVVKFRRRTDISDEIKEKILWKNPARLYGLSV